MDRPPVRAWGGELMARRVTIIGLQRLDKKLKRMPQVAKDMIRAEMGRAADEIVAMMRGLVPVDSGALRDSIGWTWGQAPRGSMVVAALRGRGVGGDLSLTIFAGSSDAYYAKWVEFGTQAHALAKNASVERGLRQDQGGKHPGTKAQPFFYVSWRANKRSIRRRVNKAVRDSAKKVAAGG